MPLSNFLDKINPADRKDESFSKEAYLGLVITGSKVKSAIWSLSEEEGKVIAFGSLENWGGENTEELIVAADASIATAVSKLPEGYHQQPTKTIFGLPESWVENDSLKGEKAEILQGACKKLLLKPVGFIVTDEAIAHWLKKEEGGLPSVILGTLEEAEITVSLIAEGKYLGSKLVGRSDNLALDFEEGLLRFGHKNVLPSRILLLDGDTLEEARQALVAYPWIGPDKEKKLNFLQLPRVESAPPNLELSAVILAGSRTLFGEAPEEAQSTVEKEEVPLQTEMPEEDFGFVKGVDITEGNISKGTLVEEPAVEEIKLSGTTEVEEKKKKETPAKNRFKSVFLSLVDLFRYIRPPKLPPFLFPKKGILAFILSIGVVLGAALLTILVLMKIEVKLIVRSQEIDKNFDFSISTKVSEVDSEKMVLPANEITVEVAGEKTAEVLGKKTVGEKATGKITIYNRTDQSKTITKDSVLKGPGNLKFLLSSEVKVASKSADLEKGVDKWGEAEVNVIAVDIGPQYNIAAGSSLVFEQAPPLVLLVKNSTAFSGGTSREIKAVSKEDKEKLQGLLGNELEGKAKEEMKTKITSSDQIISGSMKVTSRTDKFNHELGDEAESLSLEGKITFTALFLKNEDVNTLTEKIFSTFVPDGYQKEPVEEQKTLEVKDKTKNIYTAKVYRKFIPKIETGEVISRLKFKTFSKADDYLKNLDFVTGYEITVKPSFLAYLRIFPFREKNIKVIINAGQE